METETETCTVCGESFVQDAGEELDLFDPEQKAVTDTEPYHFGCADEMIDDVVCVSDEVPIDTA